MVFSVSQLPKINGKTVRAFTGKPFAELKKEVTLKRGVNFFSAGVPQPLAIRLMDDAVNGMGVGHELFLDRAVDVIKAYQNETGSGVGLNVREGATTDPQKIAEVLAWRLGDPAEVLQPLNIMDSLKAQEWQVKRRVTLIAAYIKDLTPNDTLRGFVSAQMLFELLPFKIEACYEDKPYGSFMAEQLASIANDVISSSSRQPLGLGLFAHGANSLLKKAVTDDTAAQERLQKDFVSTFINSTCADQKMRGQVAMNIARALFPGPEGAAGQIQLIRSVKPRWGEEPAARQNYIDFVCGAISPELSAICGKEEQVVSIVGGGHDLQELIDIYNALAGSDIGVTTESLLLAQAKIKMRPE